MPIDWTKPIETTCGKKARVICQDFIASDGFAKVVAIQATPTEEIVRRFTDRGEGHGPEALRNVPQEIRRTVWVNVYPESIGVVLHNTMEAANNKASDARLACLRVEIVGKEGQFDD